MWAKATKWPIVSVRAHVAYPTIVLEPSIMRTRATDPTVELHFAMSAIVANPAVELHLSMPAIAANGAAPLAGVVMRTATATRLLLYRLRRLRHRATTAVALARRLGHRLN
jgi:urease accessory protein UreH